MISFGSCLPFLLPLLSIVWLTNTKLLTGPYDQLLDLERPLVDLPVGPSRAIGQSFQAAILVAAEDLVAGLSGNTELTAQPGHLLTIEQTGNKSETFFHFMTLLPRHFALSQTEKVLPMCPE